MTLTVAIVVALAAMGLGRQLFSALTLEQSSPLTHGQDEKLLLKVKIDFRSLLARVCVCV